jgi:hypothetical protein
MPEENGEVTAEQMLAAATEYDNSLSAGEPEPQFELQQEPETEPDGSQEAEAEVSEGGEEVETEAQADAEPQSEGQDADEQVSSLTEGEAPEAKEQPKKSKWAKNEERKSRSWQEINAAKEEVKAERERLEESRKEIEKLKVKVQEGNAYRDEDGLSADDWDKIAEEAEDNGEREDAKIAKKEAKKLREKGNETVNDLQAEEISKKHQEDWQNAYNDLRAKHPELDDKDADLTQKANGLLREYPDLVYLPEGKGLRHAVQIAQWQMKAESADSSQSEVKELTEKLTKLEKKLSVNGGYTNEKVGGTRSFDELSDDEQSAALLNAALEHDNRG